MEAGRRGEVDEVEPGLWGVTIVPSVGIGQRALLVQTGRANLLWDPTGYVDGDLVEAIKQIGGLAAIASSHPHMFGVQVEWSHRFGGVPVFVVLGSIAVHRARDQTVQGIVHDVRVERAAEQAARLV